MSEQQPPEEEQQPFTIDWMDADRSREAIDRYQDTFQDLPGRDLPEDPDPGDEY